MFLNFTEHEKKHVLNTFYVTSLSTTFSMHIDYI